MPLNLVKENEGRRVMLRNELTDGNGQAGIRSIRRSMRPSRRRGAVNGRGSLNRNGNVGEELLQHTQEAPKRTTILEDSSDEDSGISEGGNDSEDEVQQMDETIAALSNPNKIKNKGNFANLGDLDSNGEGSSNDDDAESIDNGNAAVGESGSDSDSENVSGMGARRKGVNQQNHSRSRASVEMDSDSDGQGPKPHSRSKNETKADLLSKFERFEKRGIHVARKFSMKSKLSSMEAEMARITHSLETDAAIKFQRKALVGCLSTLEFLNKKFDPFALQLDGYTESVNSGIDEYDEVFEKLFEKYKGSAETAPEIQLVFTIASSALMFHLSKSFFGNSFDINKLAKANPDLVNNLAQQMAAATKSNNKPPKDNSMDAAKNSNAETVKKVEEILIDDTDRMSESSFSSDKTGVRSISIKKDKKGVQKKTLHLNI